MKLDKIIADHAQGCCHYLMHTVQVDSGIIQKGARLTLDDMSLLLKAGFKDVETRMLGEDEMDEDAAARTIAAHMSGLFRHSPVSNGRVNFYAPGNGLFIADKSLIDGFNALSPSLTIATLYSDTAVCDDEMVATFKIIPFAIKRQLADRACQYLKSREILQFLPFIPHDVTLFMTVSPRIRGQLLQKTSTTLKARLLLSKSNLKKEIRTEHDSECLAEKLRVEAQHDSERKRLFIIYGASAVMYENDVIPSAIRKAGGDVVRIGMPVEPGNLLVIGRIGEITIIGAPGCSRGSVANGLDMVLDRVLAGKSLTSSDIGRMGVGGLLKKPHARLRPRERKDMDSVDVAAIVLAAGKSSRMRNPQHHKLLARFDNETIIHKTVSAAIKSQCRDVKVVTGYHNNAIEAALCDLNADIIFNPAYEDGMAGSIVAGVQMLKTDTVDGIMILLGDMPAITADIINRLIDVFRYHDGKAIVRAVHKGKRGNPVIIPSFMKKEILGLHGDVGARAIIEQASISVIDVEIGKAAHTDIDTPEALAEFGGVFDRI